MLNRVRPGPRGVATIGLSVACVFALAALYFFAESRQDRAADHARAADAHFGQVAEQWDAQVRRDDSPSTQDMQDFAETRNLQWGIVRLEGEGKPVILQGDPAVEPLLGVVKNALEAGEAGEPRWNTVQQRSGLHAGQLQATYAVPIQGVTDREGREVENTAIVFNRFYTEGDLERAG
jgi:hypothetical protein